MEIRDVCVRSDHAGTYGVRWGSEAQVSSTALALPLAFHRRDQGQSSLKVAGAAWVLGVHTPLAGVACVPEGGASDAPLPLTCVRAHLQLHCSMCSLSLQREASPRV